MDTGVGCHGGADIDADGGGIDELHMGDSLGLHPPDVGGQGAAVNVSFQGGDQALQHHGGLAGAGNPGDHGQPPLGDLHVQRLYGMDLVGGKKNGALVKEPVFGGAVPEPGFGGSGEEGADLGDGVFFNGGNAALGDDMAALGSGLRPHFNDPVCLF